MILQENLKILTPLQKFPKNVGDLGKFIVGKGFKSCPKSNKSPNLVTLLGCLVPTTAFWLATQIFQLIKMLEKIA